VTEDTDAVAVVVSEETGLLSFVQAARSSAVSTRRNCAAIFEALACRANRKSSRNFRGKSETEEIASI
jgi:hypothetical protein